MFLKQGVQDASVALARDWAPFKTRKKKLKKLRKLSILNVRNQGYKQQQHCRIH